MIFAEALTPLPRSFYLQPTLKVAKNLLGKYFVRNIGSKLLIGKIVEVEAYRHNDPASHSYRGKTNRNGMMFGEGGHLYVYFTYGMHFCANVVTGKEGIGEAVLIRAIEPLIGIDTMTKNRFPNSNSLNQKSLINLTNGPAKFCQAFGIRREDNGLNLCDSEIRITNGKSISSKLIKQTSRIGIQRGLEKKWRYYIKNNLWVSR